jgi:tetratricopeptide (TPR) repeat protein
VLRFLSALWRFAEIRGYYKEWRDSATVALEMPEAQSFPDLCSKVHSGAGMLAYRQADFNEARRHFEMSLDIEETLGSKAGMANALNDLGNVANMRGDFEQARSYYRQSMDLEVAQKNTRGIAVARFNLGTISLALGEDDDALTLYGDSLRGFEGNGNVRESAFALFGLAQAYVAVGDLEAARGYGEKSLRIRREVGDRKGEGDIHRILGWLEIEAGNMAAARQHLVDSLKRAQELGDNRGTSEALAVAALWCARQQRYEQAVRLYIASEQIADGLTFAKPAVLSRRGAEALAAAKAALSEPVYKRMSLNGKVLTPAQAVAAAIEEALAG